MNLTFTQFYYALGAASLFLAFLGWAYHRKQHHRLSRTGFIGGWMVMLGMTINILNQFRPKGIPVDLSFGISIAAVFFLVGGIIMQILGGPPKDKKI